MTYIHYNYTLKTDFLDNLTAIEFKKTEDKTEFLKQLLQIIGMFNYSIKDKQNAWRNKELFIDIIAPNGLIVLKISKFQEVSFIANNNPKDLTKLVEILNKFPVFKKEEILLTKSA